MTEGNFISRGFEDIGVVADKVEANNLDTKDKRNENIETNGDNRDRK